MRYTEEDLILLLEQRFTEDKGNGPAWAFVPKVRNAAGFNANRTADAVAMSLWPSRGLELHGFEIKCSRADWLRELKKPEKAEQFCTLLDRFWMVVSDEDIILGDELPETWGLMVVDKRGKLVVRKQAPVLPEDHEGEAPFTGRGRSFLAALLRSALRRAATTPEEIKAATLKAREDMQEHYDRERDRHSKEIAELKGRIKAFEDASGVRLGPVGGRKETWYGDFEPAEVGAALRAILQGDKQHKTMIDRFRNIANSAESLATAARVAAGEETP